MFFCLASPPATATPTGTTPGDKIQMIPKHQLEQFCSQLSLVALILL